jgi:DNA repair protein RecO (recombination protein O)
MSLVRDRCICLRKFEYSETSQILTLFSRSYGLLRAIAKGAHRVTKAGASKFGGGIDLLDLGDAVFTHSPERDLATLTEWTLREGQLELRRGLRGMYLGLYAAELVAMLFEEHDPHVELFDHVEQVLLELGGPRKEEAFLAFELELLREAGYLPEFTTCASCGSDAATAERAFFSPSESGVVCASCEGATPDRIETDPRLLRMTQVMLRLPRESGDAGMPRRLPQLTRAQTDPINRLIAEHVEHTLSRRMRMPRYVLGNGARGASTGAYVGGSGAALC